MYMLSFGLGIWGCVGLLSFLVATGIIAWQYQGSRFGNFRWHMRNLRLKQVTALVCLFCLAMAASYSVLQEAWAILYLIVALKTGTWWLRLAVSPRA